MQHPATSALALGLFLAQLHVVACSNDSPSDEGDGGAGGAGGTTTSTTTTTTTTTDGTTHGCAIQVSCDYGVQGCTEWGLLTPQQLADILSSSSCSAQSAGPCPRAGMLGACFYAQAPCTAYWFRPGGPYASAADLEASCTQQGGTFLTPDG